uniref:Uncharacterized protein n=1 Tax=Physcomitrium patens TaxID=3218 RepID=A0A7I3ZWJ1_PHYPA
MLLFCIFGCWQCGLYHMRSRSIELRQCDVLLILHVGVYKSLCSSLVVIPLCCFTVLMSRVGAIRWICGSFGSRSMMGYYLRWGRGCWNSCVFFMPRWASGTCNMLAIDVVLMAERRASVWFCVIRNGASVGLAINNFISP